MDNDMKKYNYDKVKSLIEENKENLLSATLGMHEDWFWTADDVWKDGEYTLELMSNEEAEKMNESWMKSREDGLSIFSDEARDMMKHCVSGIYASSATPALRLKFKDGEDWMIPVYVGESDKDAPPFLITGVLSGPVQDNITPLEEE